MDALLYIPWFKLEPLYVGPIPIQPFGVLVACGVLLGMKVAEKWSQRNGVSPAESSDLVGHVLILGFTGAIILNTIFYYPEKLAFLAEQNDEGKYTPWEAFTGLSSFGGFIGALIGCWVWKRRRMGHLLPVADAASFAFPFGWFFGRLGCFVVHDHPGAITDFPLAVAQYEIHGVAGPPRHDLGLYEVFWSAGAVLVFMLFARKPRPWGFYLTMLPILYMPIRFFLDYLRADASEGGDVRYGPFTPGQYGSIAMFLMGLFFFYRVISTPPAPLPRHMKWPPPLDDEKKKKKKTDDEDEPAPKKKPGKNAKKKAEPEPAPEADADDDADEREDEEKEPA